MAEALEIHKGRVEATRAAVLELDEDQKRWILKLLLERHFDEAERKRRIAEINESARPRIKQVGRTQAVLEAYEKLFDGVWSELGPGEHLEFADFVEKWKSPLYHGRTLGELATCYMKSKTISEAARAMGLKYGATLKTVIPLLQGAGIPDCKGRWS